jgi:hypothetical protein
MHNFTVRKFSIFFISLIALSSFIQSASAQKPIELLFLMDDLNENAKSCDLKSSSIQSIGTLTLRNNGIKAIEKSSDHLMMGVTVNVAITPDKSYCIANIQADMVDFENNPNLVKRGSFSTKGVAAMIQLCESSTLVTSIPSQFSKYVVDAVEQQIKLCLGQLQY